MWGETSMRHLGKLQFAKRARLATIELNNYAIAMVKFLKKYNEITQNIGFGQILVTSGGLIQPEVG